MTRTHAFVLALAASVLATSVASCCCDGGGHRSTLPPPQQVAGAYQGHESRDDNGNPWPNEGSGATNSTAHANGNFNYSTGFVLYDVSVDYAAWMPTKIEVWAAPTGTTPLIAPGNQILEEPPPSIPTSPPHWAQSLSVPFVVGSSSYTIGIKVTFGPGQGYDLHRFTFNGLYVPADG